MNLFSLIKFLGKTYNNFFYIRNFYFSKLILLKGKNYMKIIFFLILFALTVFKAHSEIKTETIEYYDGKDLLEGLVCYDDAKTGVRPVVIVVHEWNGINEHTRIRCRQLASMGYIAFAADIYGKGIRPKNTEESAKQATIYKSNITLFRSRMNAALSEVRKLKNADKSRIAAIGYCFGGTGVLELARSGAMINGVVSFHGSLSTPNPDDAKNIKCKVLVLHGADDPFVKDEEVLAFEKEMRDASVDWQLVKFGNAVHSFTNPSAGFDNSKGAAYNEKADTRSWEMLKQFFNEIFK